MGAVDLGEDHEDIRETGIGDPGLGAVQHPVAILQHRGGLGAQGVRPAAGFGQGVGRHPFASAELGQVLRLLLVAPEIHDGQGADAGVGSVAGGEAGLLRHLLQDQQGRLLIEV